MPPNNTFKCRFIGIVSLFCWNSLTAVCNTVEKEVPGLNLSRIDIPLISPLDRIGLPTASHLDGILAGYNIHGTHVNYNVIASFSAYNSADSGSSSEMTNTDLESIDMTADTVNTYNQAPCKEPILFALNAPPHENDSKKKYLLQEDEVDMAEGALTKNLCKKLAQDACHIANADKNSFKRNATTCLCVALRDENGNVKKFVFHNGQDKMSATMAQKAQDLKYAIRTGYKAHAEAEFIQFLLQRKEQNKERYTHILGMGCSRRHCKECDSLLQLFLGKPYCMFTAATNNEENSSPDVTNTEKGCVIRPEIDAPVVYESDAVNKFGNRSEKYYLPQILQDHINQKIGLNIDFAADRFVIKDEGTMVERRQRSDKKRRVGTLPLS